MAFCVKRKNIGVRGCKKMPKQIRCMITTPENAVIPAATLADPELMEALINEKLLAAEDERWYLWPFFVGVEDNSEQPTYEETSLASIFVRNGKYRYRIMMEVALCIHRAIFTHGGTSQRVILYDVENQLFLTEKSNGDGLGFGLSQFNPENLVLSDGAVATKTPLYMELSNAKQVNDRGIIVDADYIDDIVRLMDATVSLVSITDAGEIKVKVATTCDGQVVSGLVVGDFVYKNNAGVEVVISSRTYADGVYTLEQAGNLFVDGTINLRTPDVLSLKAYESLGAAAVNIP